MTNKSAMTFIYVNNMHVSVCLVSNWLNMDEGKCLK